MNAENDKIFKKKNTTKHLYKFVQINVVQMFFVHWEHHPLNHCYFRKLKYLACSYKYIHVEFNHAKR